MTADTPMAAGAVATRQRWSWARIFGSTVALVIAYLLSQALGLIAAAAVAMATGRAGSGEEWLSRLERDGVALSILTTASAVICIPLVGWLAARVEPHPWRFLGFAAVSPRACAPFFALLAALLAVYEAANWMMGHPFIHPFVGESFASAGSVAFFVVALALIAPLAEEIVFRGFVFSILREHWGALACAAVTSLAWTAVHVQYDALELVYIFLLGMLLAWARVRTQSIAAPILLHVAANLLVIVEVWLLQGG